MSETTGRFRSAAFGGFHRQDVLDYLEQRARAHQQEKEALQAGLEEAQKAREKAEEALAESQAQLAEAAAARAAAEEELAKGKAALEQKSAALVEAEARVAALRSKVTALEPGAESWQRIRETAGNIEVSAHERAQITIQEAQLRAEEVRDTAARWLMDVQTRCQALQQEISASVTAAETELDSMRAAFDRTQEEMAQIQDGLSSLMHSLTSDHT